MFDAAMVNDEPPALHTFSSFLPYKQLTQFPTFAQRRDLYSALGILSGGGRFRATAFPGSFPAGQVLQFEIYLYLVVAAAALFSL
ncbi:MAG: hypothetical protein IKT99_06670 [Oscillospiraceae bacterium]|nr:hypothetical protein [Oscillospiraceae bacterium]